MLNQGIGSWPARRARKTPDRIALVSADGAATPPEITYRQLHERCARLAHAVRGLGLGPGDRVGYLGVNHPAFLETLFAAGMLGAVFVPLNTRLAAPEIAYQLADAGVSVLVAGAGQAELARSAAALADPAPACLLGPAEYADRLAAAPDDPIDLAVGLDDTCLVMYTSGTTGRPKGAVLTHGNITWNSVNVLVDTDLIADEVALVAAPLFHTAALNMLCLPVLLKGGRAVVVGGFDPAGTLELVERHRVTFMFGVPAMFAQVARASRFATADLSSLRVLTCGGAPVPEAVIRTYAERGLTFLQGYGMTETSPGALFLDAEHSRSKIGSAGVPHFFTDVRVVTPELADVAPGERGEVVVAGPNVMAGYLGRSEETVSASAGGWFRTGDVATVDEDGYVYVVDRVKDMIISGGENIYPAEVEDVLHAHPDVLDCAVIGVPDERWGEVGRALVVARPGSGLTEAALLASLEGRLARYKRPGSVVFVDDLPRTGAGKLRKTDLRARYGAR